MPEISMHDKCSKQKGIKCMYTVQSFGINRISSRTLRLPPLIPSYFACFFVFSFYFSPRYIVFHYSCKVTGFSNFDKENYGKKLIFFVFLNKYRSHFTRTCIHVYCFFLFFEEKLNFNQN